MKKLLQKNNVSSTKIIASF